MCRTIKYKKTNNRTIKDLMILTRKLSVFQQTGLALRDQIPQKIMLVTNFLQVI